MPGPRDYEHLDHESFDRPRRRTRPRTKERPTYDDAHDGVVVAVDRGRYRCRLTNDSDHPGTPVVTAMKSRALGRQGVVVGDQVRLLGDVSGSDDALARIVEVATRRTVLRRSADDDDPVERVLVANADQLVIVVALADPEPRTGLIDRALAAAYDGGLEPLLCLTKADLADPTFLLDTYRPLSVSSVVTSKGADLDPVRGHLRDRTSVLLGHSGVGKSTLVNALVPGSDRATAVVNDVTGRGRHTSTSAVMLQLPPVTDPASGWIVDTPGIRSFGLAHVEPAHLIEAFPDLAELIAECPRGCTHAESEPACALDVAVSEGRADPARLASYRRLLSSRETAG
jgi:ribosome biogenesis GTPase / thiamine phosphate phosphatase